MDPDGAVVRLAFPYCHIHYTASILYIQYKINKAVDDGGVYPRTRGRKQLNMSQTRVLVIINTWSLQKGATTRRLCKCSVENSSS
jgi:hypothetical protein